MCENCKSEYIIESNGFYVCARCGLTLEDKILVSKFHQGSYFLEDLGPRSKQIETMDKYKSLELVQESTYINLSQNVRKILKLINVVYEREVEFITRKTITLHKLIQGKHQYIPTLPYIIYRIYKSKNQNLLVKKILCVFKSKKLEQIGFRKKVFNKGKKLFETFDDRLFL